MRGLISSHSRVPKGLESSGFCVWRYWKAEMLKPSRKNRAVDVVCARYHCYHIAPGMILFNVPKTGRFDIKGLAAAMAERDLNHIELPNLHS